MSSNRFSRVVILFVNHLLLPFIESCALIVFRRALLFDSYRPMTYSWEGGSLLAKEPRFQQMMVTKDEYDEYGHSICQDKFDV